MYDSANLPYSSFPTVNSMYPLWVESHDWDDARSERTKSSWWAKPNKYTTELPNHGNK